MSSSCLRSDSSSPHPSPFRRRSRPAALPNAVGLVRRDELCEGVYEPSLSTSSQKRTQQLTCACGSMAASSAPLSCPTIDVTSGLTSLPPLYALLLDTHAPVIRGHSGRETPLMAGRIRWSRKPLRRGLGRSAP